MNVNRLSPILQVMTLASHTFLPHALPQLPIVVDLGANRGDFYAAFTQYFRPGRYIAVEPDAALANRLRVNPSIQLFNYAIAGSDTIIAFHIDQNAEASRLSTTVDANSIAVQGITLATLLERSKLDRIDLLKVDIEGAEFQMLMQSPDEVFKCVSQITIEFHDFCGLNSVDEILAMVDRLQSLGFAGIRFSRNNTNWCFLRRRGGFASSARFFIARCVAARLRRLSHAWRSNGGRVA